MGIMSVWEKWSQKQWDKWGSKLQGQYDGIASWKFTKEQNEALASMLSIFPSAIQLLLDKIVKYLYQYTMKKGGKEAVISMAEKSSQFINTFVSFLKK